MSSRTRNLSKSQYISRPGVDFTSTLPGSGGGTRDTNIADPNGNREQRRAAKRLGLTSDDQED